MSGRKLQLPSATSTLVADDAGTGARSRANASKRFIVRSPTKEAPTLLQAGALCRCSAPVACLERGRDPFDQPPSDLLLAGLGPVLDPVLGDQMDAVPGAS